MGVKKTLHRKNPFLKRRLRKAMLLSPHHQHFNLRLRGMRKFWRSSAAAPKRMMNDARNSLRCARRL